MILKNDIELCRLWCPHHTFLVNTPGSEASASLKELESTFV